MTSTYTQHVVEDMISTHLLISIAHPHWIGGHFQPLRKYLIDHRSVIFIIIIVFMSLEKNLPKKNRFLSHHCHRAKPSDVLFFLLQLIGKTSFVFLQNNKEIFFFLFRYFTRISLQRDFSHRSAQSFFCLLFSYAGVMLLYSDYFPMNHSFSIVNQYWPHQIQTKTLKGIRRPNERV